MNSILIINGPNLNLLGVLNPVVYGTRTLDDVNNLLKNQASKMGCDIDFYQSNAEYKIINRIHAAHGDQTDFVILNVTSFASTSLAIRDAINGVIIPYIELHIVNIFGDEANQQPSLLSSNAVGLITGFGVQGYELALQAANRYLNKQT